MHAMLVPALSCPPAGLAAGPKASAPWAGGRPQANPCCPLPAPHHPPPPPATRAGLRSFVPSPPLPTCQRMHRPGCRPSTGTAHRRAPGQLPEQPPPPRPHYLIRSPPCRPAQPPAGGEGGDERIGGAFVGRLVTPAQPPAGCGVMRVDWAPRPLPGAAAAGQPLQCAAPPRVQGRAV